MTAFRQHMNKILEEHENGIIITNPRDRGRTFLRKMAYRLAVWHDWMRRVLKHRPDEHHR